MIRDDKLLEILREWKKLIKPKKNVSWSDMMDNNDDDTLPSFIF